MFVYPTTVKRITSHFRTADRKNHHGVDIAEPGTHEIFAAAAGTVTRSYRSESYGECIMILHNINGQLWETVYAHMRVKSRKVKVGDNVEQGQAIGIMGSTGHSTGQHLHFEIHRGRWNIDKSNAVDPVDYLNKTPPSVTASKIKVLGYIKIVNVKYGAYICDRPSSTKSKNLSIAKLGARWPIAGSIPGWYEVIFEGRRAYINQKYARRD